MSYALGAAAGRWGQISTKDGFRYQITEEDVLWAARAARCEGGGPEGEEATLWTWTARFTLPNYRRRFPTLSSLIIAHSQPLNPLWRRDGARCAPGSRFHGTHRCSEAAFANRESCVNKSWDAMPSRVKDTVTKWAQARLPNPVPTAVDFASSSIGTQSGDREVARFKSPGSRHYNVFYSEAASRARPADFVVIEQDDRVAKPSMRGHMRAAPIAGIVALVGSAGVAGFAWWKFRKR